MWRRGLPFSAEVAPYLRHMVQVDEHRENLLRLQGVWDSLALLGQMSGSAAELSGTRQAFQALTGNLLDSLARRLLDNARQALRSKAQVTIDILVRNLFERTADIGFLAADAALQELVAADEARRSPIRDATRARLRAYVAKYSVYDDVIVLGRDGQLLVRLNSKAEDTVTAGDAELLAAALRPGTAYVERYGPSALLDGRTGLLYASAVQSGGAAAGVLCLSFRFGDEMQGVFRTLLPPGDRSVLALVDTHGEVLASSDRWQLPTGAVLDLAAGALTSRYVFGGREYLGVLAQTQGYEGYQGPGWSGLALLPIEHAFAQDEAGEAGEIDRQLTDGLDTRDLFDTELRAIPEEAGRIQRELSRTLWNGKLDQRADGESAGFVGTLLDEVERTGESLRQVFEQAIGNLHHSALAALREEAMFHARLASEIMDRNLYERANDCRWWALDGTLQQALDGGSAQAAAQRLQRINGLYTVYALLLLFDAQGRVLAVSDPARDEWLGRELDAPWVAAALALRDREHYVVSRHESTALYDGQASYVFAAAVPLPGSDQVGGGIAVVFDGQPQFAAILRDALPAGRRASGLLLTRSGRVVASSDVRWQVGAQGPLPAKALELAAGGNACVELEIDGLVHVAGLAMSAGYREYRRGLPAGDEDVVAVVLMPLGARLQTAGEPPRRFTPAPPSATQKQLRVASFLVDGQWLGLPAGQTCVALEQARISGLPGGAGLIAGMLEHEGRMLPVLDLAQLLYGRSSRSSTAPVLVCRCSDGRGLALLVQELGQVFAVPHSALRSAPARAGEVPPQLLSDGKSGTMLTLLDIDEIRARLGGGALAPPTAQPLLPQD